ncbi:MAG: chromate resistance protein [Polaromonas sp.]|uniref:chromate resistance protein ChrB domain-containing protein n=1 Tax=Polaromonas sp. TaxID=1869339 RepID=UPI002733A789|nr:chromate resistance protein ChrB domain-containing protein [Polaromonas sp.]MDP3795776.1 chromate resistance protein [Polaromonas sp.]
MDTSFISPQELAARMGRADAPLLLDVRREKKFLESRHMLAAARRCAPEDVAAFAASQPPREVVVYCVYGHNVSAEAAATLRAAGWNARALAGGIEGGEDGVDTPQNITQWRAHRVPTLLKRPDWGVTGEQASRWVTRERPKIDRIACPWLILRFIDPRAEFFYVPTARVFDEAARLGAVAYDIPGAPVSHEGELCSFDTLLRAFALSDPALETFARIVRGADTDRLELAAQSAGLLAFSLGLSQLHATNDAGMLEAALPLYDALYAWCRSAQAETHSWKPETMIVKATTA